MTYLIVVGGVGGSAAVAPRQLCYAVGSYVGLMFPTATPSATVCWALAQWLRLLVSAIIFHSSIPVLANFFLSQLCCSKDSVQAFFHVSQQASPRFDEDRRSPEGINQSRGAESTAELILRGVLRKDT